jgi:hypothetical protein
MEALCRNFGEQKLRICRCCLVRGGKMAGAMQKVGRVLMNSTLFFRRLVSCCHARDIRSRKVKTKGQSWNQQRRAIVNIKACCAPRRWWCAVPIEKICCKKM